LGTVPKLLGVKYPSVSSGVTTKALQCCPKGMIDLEKTATLNLRVNPDVKRKAEEILSQLGIPMSTAIDIYLKQIALTGGIPFAVTLPKAPVSVNAELMTTDEIHAKLKEGYLDIEKGNLQDASAAFQRFRETQA